MGLTSAVHWWEESQLRVLVLTSLGFQFLLFIFSFLRTLAIPGLLRFIMWLAYLAGDAVAIYALATLFNRHKADANGGGTLLEVVWAPILLLHLGGHDGITAYNIEDNELWARHLLTAVSQVTVAIYVFCKSWPPGGDRKLLQAAILLFVTGVLKCFHKPWALKVASIYSLVTSSSPAAAGRRRRNNNEQQMMMYPLEEFVKRAKAVVAAASVPPPLEQKKDGGAEDAQGASASSQPGNPTQDDDDDRRQRRRIEQRRERAEERGEANKLFVDLSSPYPLRLSIFQHFCELGEERAYGLLQRGLSTAFHLLYTKLKTVGILTEHDFHQEPSCSSLVKIMCRQWILLSRMVLPWAAIGVFHQSHREAYTHTDVNITYVLLCCSAVLEVYSTWAVFFGVSDGLNTDDGAYSKTSTGTMQMDLIGWPEMVAQYSLTGYFARNKRHSWWMWIVSLLGCKDFLDQHWCMRSCFSSHIITKSVMGYLKFGWMEEIKDAATYRRFNDHSSHRVLLDIDLGSIRGCQGQGLMMSTDWKRPFDESVLLWHLATDFCFFSSSSISGHRCFFASKLLHFLPKFVRKLMIREMVGECAHGTGSSDESNRTRSSRFRCNEELTACKAVVCRQMSNYMLYLLFVNPEMLLPGSRRNLFTAAYEELEDIFKNDKPPLETGQLMQKIESSSKASLSGTERSIIHEAWRIAQRLRSRGDDKEMWEEIQRVWAEMLCFSASRCRGYLHAKALGKGGEFLSYVWLLLFHMGMETFTDKLQREEHPIPAPPLHRLSRSAPASPHRLPRYRRAAEHMV